MSKQQPQGEWISLSKIKEDPQNARLHPGINLSGIEASLKRFGQQKPIVVSRINSIIIAGNGTFRAATNLRWKEIWVVWSTLSVEEARAYGIADNQHGLTSEWDTEILAATLRDLERWSPGQDWMTLGFSGEAIESLIGKFPAPSSDSGADSVVVEPLKDMPGAEEFDSDAPGIGEPVRLTSEQRETIDFGIQIVRMNENDSELSEGRCLELIVADWATSIRQDLVAQGHLENEEDEA